MKKGFAALYVTLLVLAVMAGIGGSIAFVTVGEVRALGALGRSNQAYAAAEAGIEDATYRIRKGLAIPASYTIAVGSSGTDVSVATDGASRTAVSRGAYRGTNRALRAQLSFATNEAKFFYGVEVGEGGLVLGDNSSVIGNVFSNGDITGAGNTKSTITGSAEAAGDHLIKDIRVSASATAARFDNCAIDGTASYVTSFTNCTASSTQVIAAAPPAQGFPISQVLIDQWKNEAAAGGTLPGYSLGNNASGSLGPKKISGDITLGNGATLTLTGTLWVTGTINFGNTDTIRLDAGYGPTSGVLLVDGAVDIGNSATLTGSGQAGSYLMLLSLWGSGDAIDVGNNATGAIFYAPNGVIDIGNNLALREATGYGLKVGNGASITYETGLADLQFSSGPGGGFEVIEWREVE